MAYLLTRLRSEGSVGFIDLLMTLACGVMQLRPIWSLAKAEHHVIEQSYTKGWCSIFRMLRGWFWTFNPLVSFCKGLLIFPYNAVRMSVMDYASLRIWFVTTFYCIQYVHNVRMYLL